jgi:hypothetical protein
LTLAWATGDSTGGNGDIVAWQGAVAAGGGGPTPPAPATAANFTTCIICIDFTAPSGGVFVNGAAVAGANAAQPNTWLDCAGASNPLWFHRNNESTVLEACPIVTKDSGGVQVMQMSVPGGITIPQGTNHGNGIESFVYPNGEAISTNNYMEATFNVNPFPYIGSCGGCGQGDAYVQGPWLGSGDGALGPGTTWNCLEFDAFEVNHDTNGGAFASSMGSWCPSGNTGLGGNWFGQYPPHYTDHGFDFTTQYVKIGQRMTSDGTTINKCMWINDVFQNCIPATVNGSNFQSYQLGDASSRMEMYYSVALFHAPDSRGPPSYVTPAGGEIGWTKSINVWACSNWKTTACTTSSANPGNYQ